MNTAACRDYIIVLPAYNEASSIGSSLDALASAASQTSHRLKRIIICLNGCTDNTEEVVLSYAKRLPITIISSPPGYIHAMNRLLGHARRYYPNAALVKTDADSVIAPDSIQLLLDQFDKHPELIVAGGHPLPRFATTLTFWQRVLAYIFSLRSIYPLAQIAVADVAEYHTAAYTDPQPTIGDAELRLKTFFHGRLWCARTSNSISNLADGVIGDDVYLTVWLYRTYGPGAIRVIYRANTYSAPNHSLRRHWMVYKRIHEDVKRIANTPEYGAIEQLQCTKLDWRYILTSVPARDAILFIVYNLICKVEEFSFEHTLYKDAYWQYQEKEA